MSNQTTLKLRQDFVAQLIRQWHRERPDLDTSAVEVVARISRAARVLERHTQAFFTDHGLQPWEYDMLAALRRAGSPYELSAGTLKTAMLVTPGAMTNRIDRMAARDLVATRTDPADRRSTLVRLTARGQALIDAIVADHSANLHRLLAGLPATDQQQLATLLHKLLLALGDQADAGRAGSGGPGSSVAAGNLKAK
jgi:DNA-binding MarR family transcriptional regulator